MKLKALQNRKIISVILAVSVLVFLTLFIILIVQTILIHKITRQNNDIISTNSFLNTQLDDKQSELEYRSGDEYQEDYARFERGLGGENDYIIR